MKRKNIGILFMVVFFCCLSSMVGCAPTHVEVVDPGTGSASSGIEKKADQPKEKAIETHISDFLNNGYAKYYVVNSISFSQGDFRVKDDRLNGTISVKMSYQHFLKDPDMLPYIKEAKEKAAKETDKEKQKQLQKEYEALKSEYNKPTETNFNFKVEAYIEDGKVKKDAIYLFAEQKSENGDVVYVPAEEILPKPES